MNIEGDDASSWIERVCWLIWAIRRGEPSAESDLREEAYRYTRSFSAGLSADERRSLAAEAIAECMERLRKGPARPAAVALRRALERHRKERTRALKKSRTRALTERNTRDVQGDSPDATLLEDDRELALQRMLAVIWKPMFRSLELLSDRPHDLILEEYGFESEMMPRRLAKPLIYKSRNSRSVALRRAREKFGLMLRRLLEIELRLEPSRELSLALKLVQGESFVDILQVIASSYRPARPPPGCNENPEGPGSV